MGILRGFALAAVLTTAGVGASQRRDHLRLEGPVTDCNLGPITCKQNGTHILYSSGNQQTMMVKGPDGSYALEAEHGNPPGNQPPPPPEVPKPTKNPSSTPPPATPLARPRTQAPPQASSSDVPLDLVVGLTTAFVFFAIMCCGVFLHTHGRAINEIPIAPPPDNGARGVPIPLDQQTQQPDPGPVASLDPQQQISNSGQDFTLPPILRQLSLEGSIGFVNSNQGLRQQPASENPDDAPQASAPSPSPSVAQLFSGSTSSSRSSSPEHHDIAPGPPQQYVR